MKLVPVVAEAPRRPTLDEVLAAVVSGVRGAIETQAGNAYWKARGVKLPDGFVEDAARNAAGALVELLESLLRE